MAWDKEIPSEVSSMLFLCTEDSGLSRPSLALRGGRVRWVWAEGWHRGFKWLHCLDRLQHSIHPQPCSLGGQARVEAFNLLIMINNPMLNLYINGL